MLILRFQSLMLNNGKFGKTVTKLAKVPEIDSLIDFQTDTDSLYFRI